MLDPAADIAFAAGFTSIRQFNATVREVFAVTPSQLREAPTAFMATPCSVENGARFAFPVSRNASARPWE